jgi:glutamyl-tRNA reductase
MRVRVMIICLSASYKHASLPMLESLNIRDEEEALVAIHSGKIATECILLQTCHRVEIYCVLQDSNKEEAMKQLMKFWSTRTGISVDIISKTTKLYRGREALMHLFYLACGLESMILGEDQILGQVRIAYNSAKKRGTVGLIFEKAFMKAINVGRRVRTETRINEGSVSISSAAVDLAARELGNLKTTRALIIGAGEAGSLAAETLKRHGTSEITIANRTFKKAVDLAKNVSGKAIKFDRLNAVLPNVDLVICAVTVAKPIFKAQQMTSAITRDRSSEKLMLIDISQPRAFEDKVGLIEGISLKTIDDLKELVAENLRNRQIEAEKAKTIISEELDRFELELSKLFVQPLISEIYRKFEEIRRKETARAIRKMGESDEKKLAILERFSRELIERIAQIPIEQLRKAALNSDGELLSTAEKIFQTRN